MDDAAGALTTAIAANTSAITAMDAALGPKISDVDT